MHQSAEAQIVDYVLWVVNPIGLDGPQQPT